MNRSFKTILCAVLMIALLLPAAVYGAEAAAAGSADTTSASSADTASASEASQTQNADQNENEEKRTL